MLLDGNPILSKGLSTENVLSKSYDLEESTNSLTSSRKQLVNIDLSIDSSNIVKQLGLVAARVENAIAGNESLRQFGDAILKYANLFLESMENNVANASKKSRQDVERVIGIAENHWLVQPNRLEIWITFKCAELVTYEWIAEIDGVTFLADENHLKEELAILQNQTAIVLFIPTLDEWSSRIVEELKIVDPFTTPSQLAMKDPQPWYVDEEIQKPVFDQICQLTLHAKTNTSEHWKFFLAFVDNGGCCGHFSIYQGENVVKSNLKGLPTSLDELIIQPTTLTTSEIVPSKKEEPVVIVSAPPSKKKAGGQIQDRDIADGKTAYKVDLPAGQFATNCAKCNVTCSRYTETLDGWSEAFCSACPGKCNWTYHSFNTSFFMWRVDVKGSKKKKMKR